MTAPEPHPESAGGTPRRTFLGGLAALAASATPIAAAPATEKAVSVSKKFVQVLGRRMAYRESGTGRPILLLHGNPTSSYLWRNVIPALASLGRCIAPDLVGMGDSEKLPMAEAGAYRLAGQQRFVDGFIEALGLEGDLVLVAHDWGSALGFDWARRHERATRGIAHMEAIVASLRSEAMSEEHRRVLGLLRSDAGERSVLQDNSFIEFNLPRGIMRRLTDEEMDEYRRPFTEPGEARRPTLVWPRELPLDGDPADVNAVLEANDAWLRASPVPKLYIRAEPGTHSPAMTAICRSWANQAEIAVPGLHYPQEDSPAEVADAIARWLRELD